MKLKWRKRGRVRLSAARDSFKWGLPNGGLAVVTITLKEQVDLLPWASVAVYTTGVIPIGKQKPGAWVAVIVGVLQLSVAVGGVHVAVPQVVVVVAVILVGHAVKTGGVTSSKHGFGVKVLPLSALQIMILP